MRFEPGGMPKYSVTPAWIGMDDAVAVGFVPEAMRQFSSATIRTRRVVSLRAALWVDVPETATLCVVVDGKTASVAD